MPTSTAMRFVPLLAFCLLTVTACAVDFASSIPAPCGQVVLVTARDWSASKGTLQRYERPTARSPWQKKGAPVEVLLGWHGLGWGIGLSTPTADQIPRKTEGDQRAPAGVFALGPVFGHASPQELPWLRMPYQRLTPTTEAIDDPASRSYNRIVDRAKFPQPDWKSSEPMWKIPDYELGLVIAHNPQHLPRAGSCIFLHLWLHDRTGTAGCTALHRADLVELLHWLDPAKQPVLVQLPVKQAQENLSGF